MNTLTIKQQVCCETYHKNWTLINMRALLDEFSAHLEQMSDDDVRASIQKAEHLTAELNDE